jgi:hypothetical protein
MWAETESTGDHDQMKYSDWTDHYAEVATRCTVRADRYAVKAEQDPRFAEQHRNLSQRCRDLAAQYWAESDRCAALADV